MRLCLRLLLPLALLVAGCGKVVDASKFTSARLLDDGRTIVYAVHELVYRPASGLAAVPDGGIPDYLKYAAVVGRYDRSSGRVMATTRLDTARWLPGQGAASIIDARGDWVLVRCAGQLHDTLQSATAYFVLQGVALAVQPLDLDVRLQANGLTLTELYFADARGTLAAVVTRADGNREIRCRLADGTWRAPLAGQLQQVDDSEVFIWQGGQQLLGYDPVRDLRRMVPANTVPPRPEPAAGVTVANDRLEYGIRADSGWQYAPLPLTLADALP